jgi:YHS domain-containing protein
MKQLFSAFLMMAILGLTSCGNSNQESTAPTKDSTAVMTTDSTEKHFDASMVDNKKDPSCGMPTSAGISDTVHYENHVLGFCSTECKNEFLKNPKAGLAAAELAK